ncbi:hypothetical protein ACH42_13090 [Endozoicomonas sp. (ex Bugula neritina AB1)]|nr:hypothetical protein ACH42_13090 [Endozoicomonas sp. (ex Bugula neritina AB1)]
MPLVVAVAVFVIVLTAYLSLLEACVLGIDEVKLATILRKRPGNKEYLEKIFRDKREHLSALVLLNTLVSIAGSSFIGALSVQVFDHIGVLLFTALLTYCMLVFAKMLPKVFAVQVAEQVIVKRAPFISVLRIIVKPALWLVFFWVRLLPLNKGHTVSRDDLHSIIRHYNKRGIIRRDERKLAEMALVAEQKNLSDLFSDRSDMFCLDSETHVSSVEDVLRNQPRKRYVVMNGPTVKGIVLYRHLARSYVNGETDKVVGDLVRKMLHLSPETTLFEAVNAFRESGASVALILPANDSPPDSARSVQFVTAKQVYQALLRAS